jgi:hypothetical protein
MSGIDHTVIRTTIRDRLRDYTSWVLTMANSWGILMLNLLALAATVTLVLLSDRSVMAGLLILIWGAFSSWIAYRAGMRGQPGLNGKRIVLLYAALTGLLFGLLKILGT